MSCLGFLGSFGLQELLLLAVLGLLLVAPVGIAVLFLLRAQRETARIDAPKD